MGHQDSYSKPSAVLDSPVEKPLRPILKKKGASAGGFLLADPQSPTIRESPRSSKANMAASFLQFCAMCEKQIMTPCNNILYCSEACRRKDGCKPLSAATLSSISPPSSVPSSPSRVILLPRTPTGSYTDLPSVRIPPELHNSKSDLDPTEWKPKLPRRYTSRNSEAFRYLSRFHAHSTSFTSIHDTQFANGDNLKFSDDITTGPASVPTPDLTFSLAGTPTTSVATSMSSNIIPGGTQGYFRDDHQGGDQNIGTSISSNVYTYDDNSYNFNTRPLPLRNNRWYSVSGATPRGTDLVTPHIVPKHDTTASEQEHTTDLWGKKVVSGVRLDRSGMKALFDGAQGRK